MEDMRVSKSVGELRYCSQRHGTTRNSGQMAGGRTVALSPAVHSVPTHQPWYGNCHTLTMVSCTAGCLR